MSNQKHARLGPSNAATWITCPGSLALVESLPRMKPRSTIYADEGTAAHELGEIKAKQHFGLISVEEAETRLTAWMDEWAQFTGSLEWVADCHRHIDGYVALLQKEFDRIPNSVIMIERRVDAGVPESWGTSDAIVLSPQHVAAIDLKYGAGVRVDAAENPQLRLYGAGALAEFGDLLGETKTVRSLVYQPRLDHVDVEILGAADLRAWVRYVVLPAAEGALSGTGSLAPSDKGCRWCDASGRCPAQIEQVFAEPFDAPELLKPTEIASALERAPMVKRWLADLEAAALRIGYEEETDIPGFKVVMSGGVRKILDEPGAVETLITAGWKPDQVTNQAPRKILGVTALEKLLGKTDFALLLNEFVEKTEGRPSLAPESDSRPAINRNIDAASVFSSDDN